MSAEPVYAPPPAIRDRLHRMAVTEQRLDAWEARLNQRGRELAEQEAELEARAKQIEHANRKRARIAKERGAELAEMNARLLERKQRLERRLQEVDGQFWKIAPPSVHGGPEGLYRATREIQEHERGKKRRAGRNAGQIDH